MAVINGNPLDNVLIGTNLDDVISGGGGKDRLTGKAGHDILNGGTGADTMVGGIGNDDYFVDSTGDSVFEAFGQGTDRVFSWISFSLNTLARFDVEHLKLMGTTSINAIGNGLANTITANGGNNVLSGLGGNDWLLGLDGKDILLGGNGNDMLNGGFGADNMQGGAGNDSYVVDSASDVVFEIAGAGIDNISSSVNLRLDAAGRLAVEGLRLTGAAVLGVGNTLDNSLSGNDFNNVLDGREGNDSLFGWDGNDTLIGGSGNDVFNGWFGTDWITTGDGQDRVVFNSPLSGDNVDTVWDFDPAFDIFNIDNANFPTLTGNKVLPKGAFHRGTWAADAEDRILYDPQTGKLFFDWDGTGSVLPIQFAKVDAGTDLTNKDFFVI